MSFNKDTRLSTHELVSKSRCFDKTREPSYFLRWPKWLTFHFHSTSQFQIPNSEICTTNFGIQNCEVYILWASGNSQSTLEGILNSQAKKKRQHDLN